MKVLIRDESTSNGAIIIHRNLRIVNYACLFSQYVFKKKRGFREIPHLSTGNEPNYSGRAGPVGLKITKRGQNAERDQEIMASLLSKAGVCA